MDRYMNNKSSSRREFCKRSLLALSAIPVLARGFEGAPALAQALPTKAVDPAGSQAVALGYVHDAAKTDLVKFPKRKGAEGEKQLCNNCMFYQQGGLKADGMDGEWGKCLLFQDGLVAAKGWCNSWSPKPA
jgi:hypothetical protein